MSMRSAARFVRILDILSTELSNGFLYCNIFKLLDEEYTGKTSDQLLDAIRSAAFKESILCIAKLVETNEEGITIDYLLNNAENHPRIFKFSTPEEIRELVSMHRKEIIKRSTVFKRVRLFRDKELVHLDRKLINQPSSVDSNFIDLNDLRDCLDYLYNALNDFSRAFQNKPLDVSSQFALVQKDVQLVSSLFASKG